MTITNLLFWGVVFLVMRAVFRSTRITCSSDRNNRVENNNSDEHGIEFTFARTPGNSDAYNKFMSPVVFDDD